jgi:DNA (cytosine-5)-methyltransferase 1
MPTAPHLPAQTPAFGPRLQPHPWLDLWALDLYCSAGGVTRGLQQAGFKVLGVDLHRQPRYRGDAFVQIDALEYLATADLSRFAFIWASPPCQKFTRLRHAPGTKEHLDLIAPTREALKRAGLPYVIENVQGAPLIDPVILCGTMFGLITPDGAFELQRHRLFEASFPLVAPSKCWHTRRCIGVYGGHCRDRRRPHGLNHRSGSNLPREHGFAAMGVPVGSMTLDELSEAVPPIYARYVAEAWLRSEGHVLPHPWAAVSVTDMTGLTGRDAARRRFTHARSVARANARIEVASACRACGEPIEATRSTRRFCSDSCRQRACRARAG